MMKWWTTHSFCILIDLFSYSQLWYTRWEQVYEAFKKLTMFTGSSATCSSFGRKNAGVPTAATCDFILRSTAEFQLLVELRKNLNSAIQTSGRKKCLRSHGGDVLMWALNAKVFILNLRFAKQFLNGFLFLFFFKQKQKRNDNQSLRANEKQTFFWWHLWEFQLAHFTRLKHLHIAMISVSNQTWMEMQLLLDVLSVWDLTAQNLDGQYGSVSCL